MSAPTSASWYWAKDRKSVGPPTVEQLRSLIASGRLAPTDLVLGPGQPNWVPAHSVPGLFPVALPQTSPQVWQYLRDGQTYGPLVWSALCAAARRGDVRPVDRIWRETEARWV